MKSLLATAAIAVAVSGAAFADTAQTYLTAKDLDLATVLPPPPASGSEKEASDRRIFRETRSLVGTPRWQRAIADTDESTQSLLRTFGCASARDLAGASLPHLRKLLETAATTGAAANNRAKETFKRPRPFTMEPGPTCQSKTLLLRNYDYPSGHAARGWMWGYILAGLIPDRAQSIIRESNDFAQSRVICGAHSESAVETSSVSAAIVLARLQGSSEFRHDLAEARHELAKLKPQNLSTCSAREQ